MADWRIIILGSAALLGACSGSDDAAGEGTQEQGTMISCAIGTASQFSDTCRAERTELNGNLFLTLHHEDGGFRRLQVMTDGSGVIAADGADAARITVYDGEIEVAVGNDHYILPATITGDGGE